MNHKTLLIVLNIYGLQDDYTKYKRDIDSIFWHIKKHNLEDKIRFVVSAVLKSDNLINDLKNHYKNEITIFKYYDNLPVQVTFNKTVKSSIEYFNENYEGYLYTSSYFLFPQIEDLFPRVIDKLYTGEYGIMHFFADKDNGHIDIESNEDIILKPGCWANLNAAVIHKSMYEFYGNAISDVHGRSSTESVYPYVCAALRKKYIILGNSTCQHTPQSDGPTPPTDGYGNPLVDYQPQDGVFLWGLTMEDIANDIEALDCGLGYQGNHDINYLGKWKVYPDHIQHTVEKYDENFFATDEKLKYAVKRRFFVSKDRFDYDKIYYNVI